MMTTIAKGPTLQDLVPKTSRVRKALFAAGIVAVLVLLAFVYRGAVAYYRENQALGALTRGSEFLSQGYFEDAKSELETAARLGRPNPKTYSLLARADSALGGARAAADNYRLAVDLEPSVPENHFALALALSALGRRQETIDELQSALDLKPDYIAARFLLAREFDEENHLKAAATQYQVLAGLDMSRKQLVEIHVALAKLLIKENRKPQAQHLLRTAWLMDKTNEEARRLIVALERGKGHADDVAVTGETTDTISSKISSPAANAKLNEDVIEIKGTAAAKSGAVVQVEVTGDGGLTWHQAQPVNGAFDQWTASLRLPQSDGSRFVLYSRAIGSAGLPESPRDGTAIFVDNTGPPVVRQPDPAKPTLQDGWYVTPPTIDLDVLEETALVFYKWDGGDYQVYTSALKAPVGIHTLSYFTRDHAGNESPVEHFTVKVKIAAAVG